tara:strand:+ start:189 stop:449 length:261 start_codon:yes stop_codon:yes gene_type:complete
MLCDHISPGDIFVRKLSPGTSSRKQPDWLPVFAMVLDIEYTSLGPRYEMYISKRDGTIRTEIWTIHTLENMEIINEGGNANQKNIN